MPPLSTIRVLDLTRHLPGPYATDILRRLGAEVIKIEPPDGDPTRWLEPMTGDVGALFSLVNSGKKSVVVDLKADEGQEFIHRLARECDVVVESYRPGLAASFRIDYESLRQFNDRIIYCSLSGFGSGKARSGHDANFVALAGLLDLQRDQRRRPVLPATQIGDMGGASFAVISILAAILERQSTGEGKFVDISMSASVRAMMPTAESLYRGTGQRPDSFFLTGAAPYYSVYRTADDEYLMVACLEPHFWEAFCHAIDRPELVPHQFDGNSRFRVFAAIEESVGVHPRSHWEEVFKTVDACVEPVLSIEEAHERFGDPMETAPLEINFPQAPSTVSELGAALDEVAKIAGYTDAELKSMKRTSTFKPRGALQRAIQRAAALVKSK